MQDPLQFGRLVEVHVRGETEPVAERAGEGTGTGGRADEGERCDLERDGCRAGPLSYHDVDAEVLHREVQHLLGRSGDAVDLVDEQHVALGEIRQHRGEIAGAFERGTGGQSQRRAEFGGDDHRHRRLAETGRAGQEDVVGSAAAEFRSSQDELQLLADPRLADEVVEAGRTQARLDVAVGADAPP